MLFFDVYLSTRKWKIWDHGGRDDTMTDDNRTYLF